MLKKLIISLTFMTAMLFAGMASAAELVNINKANAAAIQQNLVGIGPIKAEAIVSYRNKNGKFKSLDDLQNVTGLGPALIKKNKRYLSLSKGLVKGDDKAYAASKKQAGKGKSSSKKKTAAKPAKKADKTKTQAKTKTKDKKKSTKSDSKTKAKATAKPSKSDKKKTKAKKPAKKKPAKKKPAKKKKTSKSTT